MNPLPAVTIETQPNPRAAVIWLHGLGADGHDFANIVPALKLDDAPGIRFIFPHAPTRPVTLNGGLSMPAWFDIAGLSLDAKVDIPGIKASAKQIQLAIEQEIAQGIKPENIILAGFSQGGALALYVALCGPYSLAGVMGLSTYFISDKIEEHLHPAHQDTPVLIAHGTLDDIVPLQMGEISRDRLIELDYQVEWKSYAMAHQVCPEEIADISRWIKAKLNEKCQL